MISLPAEIGIEVAYAEPDRAVVRTYRLIVPACVRDALHLAAEDPEFTGIDLRHCAVGIFGMAAIPDRLLSAAGGGSQERAPGARSAQ